MIDTVKLTLNLDNLEEVEYAVIYLHKKYGCKPIHNDENFSFTNTDWSLSLKSNGIDLWMNIHHVSIKLSLWKYFMGNNLYEFNKEQLLKSIDKLQEEFPFGNWLEAKVNVLHIGPSLQVPRPADVYIEKVDGKKSMSWTSSSSAGKTKAIGSKKNYVLFYNKTKEYKNKTKIEVDVNILRIEYRIESPYWMEKYFGSKHPTLNGIVDQYNNLYNIWYGKYTSIDKDYTPIIEYVSSINELRSALVVLYGYKKCENLIEASFQSGVMSKNQRKYGYRYINDLKKSGKPLANESSPMVELDKLVEEYMCYVVE